MKSRYIYSSFAQYLPLAPTYASFIIRLPTRRFVILNSYLIILLNCFFRLGLDLNYHLAPLSVYYLVLNTPSR